MLAFNPLNAELNPICHLLALLEAHHILHVSRIRVKIGLPTCGFATKVKVKFTLEQAMKGQRGSRGTALPFL
jgi:hypothetical protein